jgi:hypothetical protein
VAPTSFMRGPLANGGGPHRGRRSAGGPPALFVGRYRFVVRIGRGGMGQVWRVVDEELGRTVALKLLHPHLAVVPGDRARFLREMQALALLEHANVVRLYAADVDPQPYIVMQLLEGITLRERMRLGPIEARLAICYAIFIAEGLGAAHRAGLVHRDVKPENVMVGENSQLWLLDLSIAQHLTGGGSGEDTDRMATLGYITPEMVRGEPAEARSDFFQLGVVLYEMIAGQKPWPGLEGASESAVQVAHACDDPEPLPEALCPKPLWEVIQRLLAKRPEDRPVNADAVVDELHATLRLSAVMADPAADAVRKTLLARRTMAEAAARAAGKKGRAALDRGVGHTERVKRETEGQRKTMELPQGHAVKSPASPSALAKAAEVARRTMSVLPAALREMMAPFPLPPPRPAAAPSPAAAAALPAAQVPSARWPFAQVRSRWRWTRVAAVTRSVPAARVLAALVVAGLVVGARWLGVRVTLVDAAAPSASAAVPVPVVTGAAATSAAPPVPSAPAASASGASSGPVASAVATAQPSATGQPAVAPSAPPPKRPTMRQNKLKPLIF